MKSILFAALVALSLVVNAALLLRLVRPATFASMWSFATPAKNTGTGMTDSAQTSGAAAAVKWETLQAHDNLPALVTRLQAAGFPPSVVRAIVSAEISERYAARRKELQALNSTNNLPYWKNLATPLLYDSKRIAAQAELRELSRQQANELKSLLGPAPASQDPLTNLIMRRQYGNIPSEKFEQFQFINQDYNDLNSQLRAATQGVTLPEDREKLAYLAKQKELDLQALFTPEEYENYQLHSSNTASLLRSQLVAFEPTEQEFRTLFKLQLAFDEQYSTQYVTMTPELSRQRAEAQKQLVDQIKETLGDERGAEYERSRDYNYQQTANLVARLDLPKATALQVWGVQQDIQQRVSAMRTDRNLTPDARNLQLAALADEAKARVTATLGARGFEAYKQYGGSWLQTLQPPTSAPATPGGSTTIYQSVGGQIIITR